MFYKIEISDHIRVPPDFFKLKLEEAVISMIKKKFEGHISQNLGVVIDVSSVKNIGEGILIPGDGAPYYAVSFELLCFKPQLQEIVYCIVKDITDFGAFMSIGPIEGMIHISQTMSDFVSFSKDKVLLGKESKRSLKIGDRCLARVVAVSYKDPTSPKFGLTMRQPLLGKVDWIEEERAKGTKK